MAKKPKGTNTSTAAAGKGGSEKSPGKIKQIGMVAKVVHQQSPKSIPIAVAVGLGVLVLAVLIGLFVGTWWYGAILGVPLGFLAGFIVFTRTAQRIQYKMLEGQTGAGIAIMENMRGNWAVTPAVNANRNMDVVHRAVGRPGVILVGEGDPGRLKALIGTEKKRVTRVSLGGTPVYEMVVGNGEGQVPVSRLQRQIMKLPRNLSKPEVAELNYRLKALPNSAQTPKGPLPKGAKMPKGPKPPQ